MVKLYTYLTGVSKFQEVSDFELTERKVQKQESTITLDKQENAINAAGKGSDKKIAHKSSYSCQRLLLLNAAFNFPPVCRLLMQVIAFSQMLSCKQFT